MSTAGLPAHAILSELRVLPAHRYKNVVHSKEIARRKLPSSTRCSTETLTTNKVQITALVLAAGRGTRLHPLTQSRNKCLWPVDGRPAIAHSLDRAVAIGAESIVVVVGYRAGDVMSAVGSCHGPLHVRYVLQPELRGVVAAIAAARQCIETETFFLSLGDEILIEPRLGSMRRAFDADPRLLGLCGVVPVRDRERVRRTYSVDVDDDGYIARVVEKPAAPFNCLMGTGNCLLRTEIFALIPATPCHPVRAEQELAALFQQAIDAGHRLAAFDIAIDYLNINTVEDIEQIHERTAAPATAAVPLSGAGR
ncbi:MAG TPA: nucleotidyltransferase family protein [Vicinamibacterales bacterium]